MFALGVLAAARCAVGASIAMVSPHAGLHMQMGPAQIFSDTANAKEEIRIAVLQAAAEHKHVLLDFGGNWCEDCQLLNIYFHDPGNASLLAANYIQVDVNVGEYDKNLDVVRRYGIPLNKGVPALAVLDGSGKLLYAQRNAEFEKIHQLDSAAVSAFLQKWKPIASTHRGPVHKKAPASHSVTGNY
ncbi:MAG: thioredoxin family protein [Acidobacteriaceae bacterium]